MTEPDRSTHAMSAETPAPGAKSPSWVTIPGGPFTMGTDTLTPEGTKSTAAPAHTVQVDSFKIARAPVSVREFARFVAATEYVTTAERTGSSWVWQGDPSVREPGQDHLWLDIPCASWSHPRGQESDVRDKGNHPVTHVSYADCLAYCEWSGCRLPTEAEWEKAARGSDGRDYTWGNNPPEPSTCNYNMNVGDTTPIGSYVEPSTPFGLQDAAGNVWEWTSSPWHPYPFGRNEPCTITTKRGTFELGVIRGGSFFNDFYDGCLLVHARVYSLREYTGYDVGFRVCIA